MTVKSERRLIHRVIEMPDSTAVECPICGSTTNRRPSSRSGRFRCPKCSQRASSAPQPAEMSPADDLSSLPPMVSVATEVAKPAQSKRIVQRANRRAYREANRDAIAASRMRLLKMASVAIVCLMAAGLTCLLAYHSLRSISTESWAIFVPGVETPEKLVRDFGMICSSFHSTCEGIDSRGARERAVGRIAFLTARLRAIPEQVSKLGTPPPQQLAALDPAWTDRIEEDALKSYEHVQTLRVKRFALSGEFLSTLQQHLDALDAAKESMTSAWD